MGEFSLPHLLILAVVLFCSIILPIITIIHAAKSTNKNKFIWIGIIFILNFFGAILYLLIGRKAKSSNIG